MSTLARTASVREREAPGVRSGFIIGPVSDALFIIGAPLLALGLAIPLFALPAAAFQWPIMGQKADIRQVFILAFIEAHLVLVYFRSHGNVNIFRAYPLRFTVVPIALVVATVWSPYLFEIIALIAIWWDVYHSSLQTFGFGRIYDAKLKNAPTAGRRLDYWMSLFLYTGPVLAGAHFVDHLNLGRAELGLFAMSPTLFSDLLCRRAPDFFSRNQVYLAAAVLGTGVPFLAYYLYSYRRLEREGYRVSWQKVWLYIITGSVSIYVWGFRSFFDAFWVMNFFHALQYFAIVSFTERQNLSRLFRVDRIPYGGVLASVWTVTLCLLYGLWVGRQLSGSWTASLVLTTSIMHFWYDGFIWSVKKKQV